MLVVKRVEYYDCEKNYEFYRLFENSWSGAKDTLEDIISAEKEEEFMEHLDMIFSDRGEIEDTELNDYIWFERAEIYEALGLDENGELIEEE